MVQRAKRDGDPWSGDMAFPGGRTELQDRNYIATARRETEEETGVTVHTAPLKKLDTLWTKSHNNLRPMAIHPYLFNAPPRMSVTLSHELADTVWVPLTVFRPQNRQHFIWKTRLMNFRMPCFYYRQYKIWGLSLKMIENLLSHPEYSELVSASAGLHTTDKL